MNLDNLPKINTRGAKRIGRGQSSGKGKTSGRGQKGQNARGKLPITHSHFEGGQRPLIKRLPFRRGKGNKKVSPKAKIINWEDLNKLPQTVTTIDIEVLLKHGLIEKGQTHIKILGKGKINRALKINLPSSKSVSNSSKTVKTVVAK